MNSNDFHITKSVKFCAKYRLKNFNFCISIFEFIN